MPCHWTTLRAHNEAQRHAEAVRSLREHPLALRPDERERLEQAGVIRPIGEVVPFTPAPWGRCRDLAERYLRLTDRPRGTIKRLAIEGGVTIGGLLQAISRLQERRDHAHQA